MSTSLVECPSTSRRDFLAANVAGAVAATLLLPAPSVQAEPPALVEPPAPTVDPLLVTPNQAPSSSSYWLLRQTEGGRRISTDLTLSRAEADETAERQKDYSPAKVYEVQFRPLAAERRFVVCGTEWRWRFDYETYSRDFGHESQEQFDARYAMMREAFCEPESLLDVPPAGFDHEYFHCDDDLLTRTDALALAAELNAEILHDQDRKGRAAIGATFTAIGGPWNIIVELGEPLTVPLSHFSIKPNGLGIECRLVELPIRLVVPSEAERAALPAPEPHDDRLPDVAELSLIEAE